MSSKVVKFGGSSLADANQFRKVAAIIKADKQRRFVVPSAPGKRFSDDVKITDMLYKCCELAGSGGGVGFGGRRGEEGGARGHDGAFGDCHDCLAARR